jgi:hypothetical protein
MSVHIRYMKELSCRKWERIVQLYYQSAGPPTSDTLSVMSSSFDPFGADFLDYVVTDIRRDSLLLHGERRDFHRLFLCARDSGSYSNVGWVFSRDIKHCMVCGGEFLLMKHHCRACGNVVCGHCSSNTEPVDCIEEIGPVRVCDLCCYGQSPVTATFNTEAGQSLTVLEDCDALLAREFRDSDEFFDRDDVSQVGGLFTPLHTSHRSQRPPQNFRARDEAARALYALRRSLPVQLYGRPQLKEVRPVLLLRAHYFLPYRLNMKHQHFASSSDAVADDDDATNGRGRNGGRMKPKPKKHFVYVNLCACPDIPVSVKAPRSTRRGAGRGSLASIPDRDDDQSVASTIQTDADGLHEDEDQLFCIVLSPLSQKYQQKVPVLDCGINADLVDQMMRNTQKLQAVCLQVLAGVSIEFPELVFNHYELLRDYPDDNHIPVEGKENGPRNHFAESRAHSSRRSLATHFGATDSDGTVDGHEPADHTGKKRAKLFMTIPTTESFHQLPICFSSITDTLMGNNVADVVGISTGLGGSQAVRNEEITAVQTARSARIGARHHVDQAAQYRQLLVRLVDFLRSSPRLFLSAGDPALLEKLADTSSARGSSKKASPTAAASAAATTAADSNSLGLKYSALQKSRLQPSLGDRGSTLSVPPDRLPIDIFHSQQTDAADSETMSQVSGPSLPRLTVTIAPLDDFSFSASASGSQKGPSPTADKSLTRKDSMKAISPTNSTLDRLSRALGLKHSGMMLPRSRKPIQAQTTSSSQNEGRKMLTAESLEMIREKCIDSATADKLKEFAKKDHALLLGWQVLVLDDQQALKGLFVVTGLRHFSMHGALYRLSNLEEDDQWIKLRLSPQGRVGFSFQPLRRVLALEKKT